jgi:hypothetical protein
MCEIEFDDDSACDKLSERDHVARVPHRCSSCGAMIHPGERYRALFLTSVDGPAHEKICPACLPDLEAFNRAHGVWVTPSSFDVLLEQCIEDEPDSRPRWEPVLEGIRQRNRIARGVPR